jgi:hypothetical protein
MNKERRVKQSRQHERREGSFKTMQKVKKTTVILAALSTIAVDSKC